MDNNIVVLEPFSSNQIFEHFCHPSNFFSDSMVFEFTEEGEEKEDKFRVLDGSYIITSIYATGQDQAGKILEETILRDAFNIQMSDHNSKPYFNKGTDLFNMNKLSDDRRFKGFLLEHKADLNIKIKSNNNGLNASFTTYTAGGKTTKINLTFVGYKVTNSFIKGVAKYNPEIQRILDIYNAQ